MGFDWNAFYTIFKTKLEAAYSDCTVGRYAEPKETSFPYCDIALTDISGGNYDLCGTEGSQSPMITVTAYATGSNADSTCINISNKSKEVMTSYGFQCKSGPVKVTNANDTSIIRWVARYQRVFGNGDSLSKVN